MDDLFVRYPQWLHSRYWPVVVTRRSGKQDTFTLAQLKARWDLGAANRARIAAGGYGRYRS